MSQDDSCSLTVIIVNWNTRELVLQCIDSVVQHLGGNVALEIIVVDNGSTDGSATAIRQRFPEIRLIENEDNRGFSEAVNQAAALASGRFLLLLNSDATLLDSGILDLLKLFEQDPRVGIATGQMLNTSGVPTPAYYRFPTFIDLVKSQTLDRLWKIGRGARGRARLCKRDGDGRRLCEVDWVSGGYLVVRRELVADNGLFDERIFMYFEDTLLCLKAWNSGYRVVYLETGKVQHVHNASAQRIVNKAAGYSYESSRVFVQEYYGRTALLFYEFLNRTIWRLSVAALGIARVAVDNSKVDQKRDLLRSLLSIARVT